MAEKDASKCRGWISKVSHLTVIAGSSPPLYGVTALALPSFSDIVLVAKARSLIIELNSSFLKYRRFSVIYFSKMNVLKFTISLRVYFSTKM